MGRQERERKERQRITLEELAKNNPERFAFVWESKVRTYSDQIWRAANEVKREETYQIVERAQRELKRYGAAAVYPYGSWTKDVLENEACKALASAIDPRLYHLNQSIERS
jgi:hypothetical protein